jgi:hypothetical protein
MNVCLQVVGALKVQIRDQRGFGGAYFSGFSASESRTSNGFRGAVIGVFLPLELALLSFDPLSMEAFLNPP